MLELPKSTEINRPLPKKVIYEKFNLKNFEKVKIDADISRIAITHEVCTKRTNIAEGKEVKSFYVLHVLLKREDFSEQGIITISKLIPQNILFILQYEGKAKLAVLRSKLISTEWVDIEDLTVSLTGLNLDKVWENIIVEIGNIKITEGNTLDEQISEDERQSKLRKEIEKLEKKARAEVQPRKIFELVHKINSLKKELR